MSKCLVDPQLKYKQCCCCRPSRRTLTRLWLNHSWCRIKTEIPCRLYLFFGACALGLEERSEPRALLLGTLWHGLPRARASAHLRTHAHAPKDSKNQTNPLRLVEGFQSSEFDILSCLAQFVPLRARVTSEPPAFINISSRCNKSFLQFCLYSRRTSTVSPLSQVLMFSR